MTTYKPYTGPTGPTMKQTIDNTIHLQKQLKKIGINSKRQDLSKRLRVDPGTIELIITRKDGKKLYTGYDRFGFVLSNEEELLKDQIGLDEVFSFILNWHQD